MSDNARLSSEQALDDYFFDLLAEPEPEDSPALSSTLESDASTSEAVNASEESTDKQDLPRPDNRAVYQDAGPIIKPVSIDSTNVQSAAPFDFDSLDQAPRLDEPLLAVNAFNPQTTEKHTHLSWYEPAPASAGLEGVQRLLSQMGSASVAEPVISPQSQTETLSDEWLQVMAHDAQERNDTSAIDVSAGVSVNDIDPSDANASVANNALSSDAEISSLEKDEVDLGNIESPVVETVLNTQAGDDIPPDNWQQQHQLGSEFQALFFDVNGVTFAVPLAELGGIHQLGDVNHLLGRPPWYLGLMTSREHQLNVVDTARWVMPEKLNDDEHREQYRYLVMLGDSRWGLACNTLQGTETLTEHSVRWREKAGKRPWLAGMVKEKMCALIHVSELISMLNAGLDVRL
ncbi:chemotaxis protein CheW [Photobacterium makurazakiensis]|uniref:chemotaxis protein CheW n=1 Tax=Photobacterium makurazakiensis TaxID=2910234 RepID=UPI003D0960E0